MPLASRIRAGLASRITRRFATRADRFRVALALGFLISAVGFMTVVADGRDGIADSMFGLGDLFGAQPAQQAEPPAQNAAPARGMASWLHPRHARREASRHRVARIEPARYLRAVEREDRKSEGRPFELGRQSMCVRLCDGFAFPIGAYHGSEDRASHEATCHAECPGAQTALYVVQAGSDSIEDAVRVGTEKNYSELPYAFHYTSTLSEACTCHPASGNTLKSALRDFTLRRGDAVMTRKGFKVFHGGGHFPYRRSDFLTLAQSRDIGKGNRAAFSAIERASLISSPNIVAQSRPAWKPQAAPVASTRALERQASLTPPAAPRP